MITNQQQFQNTKSIKNLKYETITGIGLNRSKQDGPNKSRKFTFKMELNSLRLDQSTKIRNNTFVIRVNTESSMSIGRDLDGPPKVECPINRDTNGANPP